jgi:hypothetical protein
MFSKSVSSYPVSFSAFNGFGAILSRQQSLVPGQSYTFTFTFPWYSQYPSNSDAIRFLGASLSGIASIVSASRALFSSNYVVTIVPSTFLTVDEFVQAFSEAWESAPWYVANPDFVQVEDGVVSSQPGGIEEIVPTITGGVGETVSAGITAAVKPLLPYVLIGGGIYVLILFGPQLRRRLS